MKSPFSDRPHAVPEMKNAGCFAHDNQAAGMNRRNFLRHALGVVAESARCGR